MLYKIYDPAYEDNMSRFTSFEICAGGGGQALGLSRAGFTHIGLVDNDVSACATLKLNRPKWNVIEADLTCIGLTQNPPIDLLAGGLPCPPFSIAGKQLGKNDGRDLFPEALRLTAEAKPKAIMIENVRGLLDSRFEDYRIHILGYLVQLGYMGEFKLFNAADFGVPQNRWRTVLVAMRPEYWVNFKWPKSTGRKSKTVGDLLFDLMASKGWQDAATWKTKANSVAPTIVGGSKKHGGPDLGPSRVRKSWEALGVDGLGIANEPPEQNFRGLPRLTPRMVARIQSFPDIWNFAGGKTAQCRQIGNAFPPPLASAVAKQVKLALTVD